jgi:hypothetical protein
MKERIIPAKKPIKKFTKGFKAKKTRRTKKNLTLTAKKPKEPKPKLKVSSAGLKLAPAKHLFL